MSSGGPQFFEVFCGSMWNLHKDLTRKYLVGPNQGTYKELLVRTCIRLHNMLMRIFVRIDGPIFVSRGIQ